VPKSFCQKFTNPIVSTLKRRKKHLYAKAARKILVKLTPGDEEKSFVKLVSGHGLAAGQHADPLFGIASQGKSGFSLVRFTQGKGSERSLNKLTAMTFSKLT
jgi:hypothetical protein